MALMACNIGCILSGVGYNADIFGALQGVQGSMMDCGVQVSWEDY